MAEAEAPGELELVRRFLNTADLEAGHDDLGTAEDVRAWFTASFGDPGEIDSDSPGRVAAVREAIRGLAMANNGGAVYPVDLATLNRVAAEVGLRPRFGAGAAARLEAGPDSRGLERGLGRLVGAVYDAMATGDWRRFKVCARHSCRWAFFDGSRNQSRTWCSMRVCGNRAKAQRHRSRALHS